MNISQWKNGDGTFFSLEVDDRLLLIETHFEGLSFPCQVCGKTFRSRNALQIHNTRFHK